MIAAMLDLGSPSAWFWWGIWLCWGGLFLVLLAPPRLLALAGMAFLASLTAGTAGATMTILRGF